MLQILVSLNIVSDTLVIFVTEKNLDFIRWLINVFSLNEVSFVVNTIFNRKGDKNRT